VHDRRVVYYVATSLDGFVAREDGAVDWLSTDEDLGFEAFCDTVDTVLMGRRTYEQVLGFGDYPYGDKKGYVFSRTRAGEVDEHVRFLDDTPESVVAALRDAPGGHLWLVGGGELAASFLAAGLIDELRVAIHPIVLGSGRPLFDGAACEHHFELAGVDRHPNGLLQCEYVRVDPGAGRERVDPSIRALWNTYLERNDQDPAHTPWTFTADRFGDSQELADELCNLILTGRKRATAPSVAELEATGRPLPRVGDHTVVLDGRGVARAIVRTTRVRVCAFEHVTRAFAGREGEGDGSLENWRRDHQAYYERVLAASGRHFSPNMDVVCEEFELVFGPRDLLAGLVDDD